MHDPETETPQGVPPRRASLLEVQVRSADQLHINPCPLPEIDPRVCDNELSCRVREGKAEVVILQPIRIEGSHLYARNGLFCFAIRNAPTDCPHIKQRQHRAPETVRQTVVPHGDKAPAFPVAWLQGRDSELTRFGWFFPIFWRGTEPQ